MIYPEWGLLSDHAPLTVDIVIIKYIQTKKYTIVKNSEEEKNFIAGLIEAVKRLNIEHISTKENLEWIVQKLLILQNTQNYDRMRSVKGCLKGTESQSESKIGESLEASSK